MKKKLVAIILTVAMVLNTGILPVFATDASDSGAIGTSSVCEHHTEHTPECGFAEGTAEVPCDKGCTDTDGDGAINHADGCAYRPASEGAACGFDAASCEICNPSVGTNAQEEPTMLSGAEVPEAMWMIDGTGEQTGSLQDAINAMRNTNSHVLINLQKDVTVYDYLDFAGNATLALNGYTINRVLDTPTSDGYVIRVRNGSLTIFDYDGTGKITGGNSTGSGGGVYVEEGEFRLDGGIITGNKAKNGGGVYVSHGSFTMDSGKISGNTANGSDINCGGGGVFVDTNAAFIMYNGNITNNVAEYAGGGVYTTGENTTSGVGFALTNGTISGNNAKHGGGVYVNGTGASFEMSGGSISNNTASTCGGGVCNMERAHFTMAGGEISGNKINTDNAVPAEENQGGGVCNYTSSSITSKMLLTGAPNITGNFKNNEPNNVQLSGAPFEIRALGSGAVIGVHTTQTPTAENPVIVAKAQGTKTDYHSYFTSDNGYTVYKYDDPNNTTDSTVALKSAPKLKAVTVYKGSTTTEKGQYDTLRDAISAARDGDTVKINEDITFGGSYVSIMDAITLDLNGKSVAYTGSSCALLVNDHLTLTGGGTLSTNDPNVCTIKQGMMGKITISGGTVVTSKVVSCGKLLGTIVLEDLPKSGDKVVLDIQNGTVSNTNTETYYPTYSLYVADYADANNVKDYYSVASGSVIGKVCPEPAPSISSGSGTKDDPYKVKDKAGLEEALQKPGKPVFIKITQDIELDNTITIGKDASIDLGGKNITVAPGVSDGKDAIIVNSPATVTINGSGSISGGNGVGNGDGGNGISGSGNVTVGGGTAIIGGNGAGTGNGGNGIDLSGSGTVTIENGTSNGGNGSIGGSGAKTDNGDISIKNSGSASGGNGSTTGGSGAESTGTGSITVDGGKTSGGSSTSGAGGNGATSAGGDITIGNNGSANGGSGATTSGSGAETTGTGSITVDGGKTSGGSSTSGAGGNGATSAGGDISIKNNGSASGGSGSTTSGNGAETTGTGSITVDGGKTSGGSSTSGSGGNGATSTGGNITIGNNGSANGGSGATTSGSGAETTGTGSITVDGGTTSGGSSTSGAGGNGATSAGGDISIKNSGSATGGDGTTSGANGAETTGTGSITVSNNGSTTGGKGTDEGGDGAKTENGNITISGGSSANGGSSISGSGGSGAEASGGHISVGNNGSANGGSGATTGGSGAETTGTGSITIGNNGSAAGGSCTGNGNGGNGAVTEDGNIDIAAGGSAAGGIGSDGKGSTSGGNGGTGTVTGSAGSTTVNGSVIGGNGGNGADNGSGNAGNGGIGAKEDGSISGSGTITGGNGGNISDGGTGTPGNGGTSIVGGGDFPGGTTAAGQGGLHANAQVDGQKAGTTVTAPNQDLINAAITSAERTDNSISKIDVTLKVEQKSNPSDKNKVDGALKSGQSIAIYLDIVLEKTLTKDSGTTKETIKNANAPISITITIPESMRGGSNYKIIRVHDGVAETITPQYDAKLHTLTIKTKKFSTYAIAYTPAPTVTYSLAIDGGVGASGIGKYSKGASVSIKAGTKDGYSFSHWSSSNGGSFGNVNSAATTFIMPANDVTLTAHWTPNSGGYYYGIKISKEGKGTIYPDGGSSSTVTVPEWNDQAFTFTPQKGYEVRDVIIDGKSVGAKASYTFEDVTGNHTLKVIFKVCGAHVNPQTSVDFGDAAEK